MNKKNIKYVIFLIVVSMIVYLFNSWADSFEEITASKEQEKQEEILKSDEFKIILSSENEDVEPILKDFALKEDINLVVEYAGTLDIMAKLNAGEQYDAVWASNSIWLYMLEDSVSVSESKSTSINPVVFAITKSKAESLGFVDREIYTKEIVDAIQTGNLKFSMSNPTQTNSGATAYLGLLSTLAGNPEVLKKEHLENEELKTQLVNLFSGLERSSGSEEFLEELFLNGNYESVVTYESSIININMELEKSGKEPLYVLYPVDGVSISDSPFAYIDNGIDGKKEQFLKLRDYILSDEGQQKLARTGRRTWFGGVNENVNLDVFDPEWGIDTTRYIVPIKFPSTTIIQEALSLYQTELRKPIYTIFCLDYSGSMYGDGYEQLKAAMSYILTDEAKMDLLQFVEKDKISVIPFSSNVIDKWTTDNGAETDELLDKILELEPYGSTNIYDTLIDALDLANEVDTNTYNLSIILMTDGLSNVGTYSELSRHYKTIGKEIPIYSIMFGNAYESQLEEIAELTNAKIFDGRTSLLEAFKEVRGYN